mgnify:CR=1 FL=1
MTNVLDNGFGAGGTVSSGQVQAQAARSLALLHASESTVRHLTGNAEISRIAARDLERLAQRLRAEHPRPDLDPEGRTADLLRQCAEGAERLHASEIKRRDAARRECRLTGDDGVEDACTDCIAAIAEYHAVVSDLCDALLVSTAAASPRHEVLYTDADALVADILAGR